MKGLGEHKGPTFDDDTDITARTDETDLEPLENILNLTVFDIEFNHSEISRNILKMDNPMESAVQTFVTIDFFNHDTANTDVKSGFNPTISQKFSFRNKVEEFYISHLSKEVMNVEVYILKGKHPEKIGKAELILNRILNGDTAKYPATIYSETTQSIIGKLQYKMAM